MIIFVFRLNLRGLPGISWFPAVSFVSVVGSEEELSSFGVAVVDSVASA